MRIVGGRHRGRPIAAPEGPDVRPTSDRVREALFNLLSHGRIARDGDPVAGAHVLDAFAGAGALALEALSRGAASATAFDLAPAAIAAVKANARSLRETVDARQADATRPPPAETSATLVFLDPPYGKDMAAPTLQALDAAGWIAPGAVVSVETGAKEELVLPPGFALEDARRYGRSKIWLLRRAG